jgi:hypothetical protein
MPCQFKAGGLKAEEKKLKYLLLYCSNKIYEINN